MNERLKEEIEILENDSSNNAEIIEIDEENLILTIGLNGPKGSKYEDKIYEIDFIFSKYYPFKPPKLEFKTPIDFPLHNFHGTVDIFSLFGENYTPEIRIKDIIERIIFFMSPVETRIDTYENKRIDIYLRKNQ